MFYTELLSAPESLAADLCSADGYYCASNDAVRRSTAADGSRKGGFHDVPGFPACRPTTGFRLAFGPNDDSRRLAHARRRSRGDGSRFAAERLGFEGAVRAPLRPKQRKRAARRVPSTADHRPRQFRHQTLGVPRRKASSTEHNLHLDSAAQLPLQPQLARPQSSVASSARRRTAPRGIIIHAVTSARRRAQEWW